MIRSTCFGHFYAHHELETMCVLPPMVCSSWLLVVRGQVHSSRLRVQEEGKLSCAAPTSWTHSLLPCTWPPTTSHQALHTIGGNNTHIVLSSWWWTLKCQKHVECIISAIKHSVTSSWFFFSTHMQRCMDKHTSNAISCLKIYVLPSIFSRIIHFHVYCRFTVTYCHIFLYFLWKFWILFCWYHTCTQSLNIHLQTLKTYTAPILRN